MIIYFQIQQKNESCLNKLITYSLEPFDSTQMNSCNKSHFLEFEIPDSFDDDYASELCEKMIIEYQLKGTPLKTTLQNELIIHEKFLSELTSFETFVAHDDLIKEIVVNVSLVYRGNFNDERLISSLVLNLKKLNGKPPHWFDLYLGNKSNNNISIAPIYTKGKNLYFLEKHGGSLRAVRKNGFSMIYSTDFDDKYIISTEIYYKT